MQKDLHPIQANILKELLLRTEARFSEVNSDRISSDQFTFHLKQLLDSGIVEKTPSGTYRLTIPGKEYASRFDIDSTEVKIEKQAKIGVLVIAYRKTDSGREYVMQTRLKHPFFGFRGFVTGKVKMGESVPETAARELKEEAGLSGEITHGAVYHELVRNSSGELLEDKYFFICTAEGPTGELLQEFQGGRNEWVKEENVLDGNIFYDVEDLLKLSKQTGFFEKTYIVEGY